jgi:hypothetical protein
MPMGKRIAIRRLNIFVDAQSTRIAIVPKGAQKLAGLYNPVFAHRDKGDAKHDGSMST